MRDPAPEARERQEPGLVYFVRLALRRWRFLALVSLLSGVLALALGFLLPRWYEARSTVLPPRETQPHLMAQQQLIAALQIQSLFPYAAGVTTYDIYLAILQSDTVARSLVDRFDLRKHYHEERRVRAMAALRGHTVIAPGKHRIVEIRVEDKDPELAARLANAYVAELDSVYRATRSTAGRRQGEFLQARVARVRADLDSAEARLAGAEGSARFPVLSRDLTQAALSAGDLIGRRLALSVRLDMLDAMGVGDAPARRELELELRAVESEAAQLPGLGMAVARRLREVRIQETLYEALSQDLEAARIEEARDTPEVEVLDLAVPPDRQARPRKGLMAVAGAIAGMFAAMAWAVYWDPRT